LSFVTWKAVFTNRQCR